MADLIDIAQERQAETLARLIHQATHRPITPPAYHCQNCGEPIPAARRAALVSVSLCVTCQEVTELKNKHYRGAI